jgi:hypothetical protein
MGELERMAVAASSPVKAGFEAHLAAQRQARQQGVAALGSATQGLELVSESGKRWAFLLPDMTEPGRWRLQYFDERGFSGHAIYDTEAQLLEAAWTEGFRSPAPGALDRIAQTPSFQRGNFAADLIRRINLRELTHEQANDELAAYDAASQ